MVWVPTKFTKEENACLWWTQYICIKSNSFLSSVWVKESVQEQPKGEPLFSLGRKKANPSPMFSQASNGLSSQQAQDLSLETLSPVSLLLCSRHLSLLVFFCLTNFNDSFCLGQHSPSARTCLRATQEWFRNPWLIYAYDSCNETPSPKATP